MSPKGQSRRFDHRAAMSASPPGTTFATLLSTSESGMCGRLRVGKSFLHVCSIGRCSHVFGLLVRHTRPLALMPSADQVPVNSSHSTMLWPMWVVLIAGSTGSALRAVRPPNLHITPDDSQRDLYYAASATGSLYRSPLAIMAQAILAILLASATAATFVGRRANNAVSQGRCLAPWILA